MKKEYDFSKGTRGKFSNVKAKINLPIYLNQENLNFVQKIAKKTQSDLSSVVNRLIKSDKHIAKIIEG